MAVYHFDGGYDRDGYIVFNFNKCDVCGKRSYGAFADASEGEYAAAHICLKCVKLNVEQHIIDQQRFYKRNAYLFTPLFALRLINRFLGQSLLHSHYIWLKAAKNGILYEEDRRPANFVIYRFHDELYQDGFDAETGELLEQKPFMFRKLPKNLTPIE